MKKALYNFFIGSDVPWKRAKATFWANFGKFVARWAIISIAIIFAAMLFCLMVSLVQELIMGNMIARWITLYLTVTAVISVYVSKRGWDIL
jgi:hypothetical protein